VSALLFTKAHSFLERSFAELKRKSIALDKHWHIDHLCFRTSTQENYLSTKKQFEGLSKLLIESEVNGRLISTFKLEDPILFHEWEIDLIEVPAPKKGKIVADGFEHFEVVCDLTFDDIKNRYSRCKFDESGLAKNLNQELEIIFDGFALKFHPLSLESVINLETNASLFSALNSSEILKTLKSFNPLVAGTFPLNVNVADSDVDILISGNLNQAKKIMQGKFGDLSDFKCDELMVQGEPTLLSSFSYHGIDFEIFGQRTPSIRQRGYLHFLVEERLLKIGGVPFAEKIKEARLSGIKTEPAFAKVLGLRGDPYDELLLIQKKSNQELKDLISSL